MVLPGETPGCRLSDSGYLGAEMLKCTYKTSDNESIHGSVNYLY